jgi:hypothetical protein
MESKLIILATALSNLATFFLTQHFTQKERKNDLESKLLLAIEELTGKYLELNKKYIALAEKQERHEKENTALKLEIEKLKKAA